jgi:hypothetical protein
MANDIMKAISANAIKNGTSLVSCTKTGEYGSLNTYVKNTPILSDIESRYDERFDDPSYYYGGGVGSLDGGTVGDSLIVGG